MTSNVQALREQVRTHPTIVRTPVYHTQGCTTTPWKPSDSARSRRPHTPPVPVLPLEPIVQSPPQTNHGQSLHGPSRPSIPLAQNVQPRQGSNNNQLLYTPRAAPRGPPVPREESVESNSARYHQDQLLEQMGRLRDRQKENLKRRRQEVEEQVAILLNWQHLENSLSTFTPLNQNPEFVASAPNFAVGDARQRIVLGGLELELKNEIYTRSLNQTLLPLDWGHNLPIRERFLELLEKLESVCEATFETEREKVRQMSYEEAVAKRNAYAHILRVGERNAIAVPVAMTTVGNFELIAKAEEGRRDSQVAQEESELGSESWLPLKGVL